MAKRKLPDPTPEITDTPSKRRKKTIEPSLANGIHKDDSTSVPMISGTSKKKQETPSKNKGRGAIGTVLHEEDNDEGSPTPKSNGRTLLFSTPRKEKSVVSTPSKPGRADRSAKRKSAQALAEAQDEDDWDGQRALAREILEDEEAADRENVEQIVDDATEGDAATPVKTPGKRGRPKGAKNKRSPTPDGDIAPEERYFFQTRSGPPQVSGNKFDSVKLLTYEEYFEQIQSYKDRHASNQVQLMKLHARSFPQWQFELAEGFGLCLYGYGSKRQLVNNFAEWICKRSKAPPRIVVVNGYTPKLNVRGILKTVASAIWEEDQHLQLVGQPQEMLDTLFSHLTNHPPDGQLMVMINSIDASALRGSSTQAIMARLARHPLVHFIATADSPTFPVLWNSSLLDQFKFVFHDCTTFSPYTAEINVVDEVHELLGRKRLRVGGKEGVGFVLKSLPENARNLYRLLLSEILSVLADGGVGGTADEEDDAKTRRPTKPSREAADEVGIEYRTLYQKASEEFICSSSMNFQFLLKEFHDHQMVTSRRDASGTEVLGIPLSREEMEAVLEDLVV
ncbi:uncharacterized protein Z518_00772 [Rhinocladiella mackenziei CBS 650.93]|uniref:Origin recognition complex subunit 2 n=1 Tax=Rhinocladiella mackenziei CBS 650.93 TaxID=1442369 RepID=A0A0D2J1W8_9EURO|nr:uncharacterized protein Z518_00772 [Rhinocladiella mackenziei CBS 650.93]KIX09691.1 hypothetical protein Z518_00772 [Rhinocladiella mackenziei CBS 650.93]